MLLEMCFDIQVLLFIFYADENLQYPVETWIRIGYGAFRVCMGRLMGGLERRN